MKTPLVNDDDLVKALQLLEENGIQAKPEADEVAIPVLRKSNAKPGETPVSFGIWASDERTMASTRESMAKKKVILCDSNVLFDYFRGVPAMVQELEELGFDRLYLSVISEAEMYAGMKRSEKRKTTETINEFNVIGLDTEYNSKMSL